MDSGTTTGMFSMSTQLLSSSTHLPSQDQTSPAPTAIVVQNEDYDWVLPVVILLVLLIVVLFVMVLLLYRKQGWWCVRKRNRHLGEHKDDIEMDRRGPKPYSRGEAARGPSKAFLTFSKVFNTNKYAITPEDCEVTHYRSNLGVMDEEDHIRGASDISEDESDFATPNYSPKSPSSNGRDRQFITVVRSGQSHSELNRSRNNSISEHSFENNFVDDAGNWGDTLNIHNDKDGDSYGVNNPAFLGSDSESVGDDGREGTEKTRGLSSGSDKFAKSQSCGTFVDGLDNPHSLVAFDRQLSNVSAPVYSHGISESPKLGRSLGKFETVYNLATTDGFESESSPDENRRTNNFDQRATDSNICHQFGPGGVGVIPKIILPDGHYIDFDDHRHEDTISYYNSSSLESCVSFNSVPRRIARANNPFNPEGVQLQRPSSAPCLFASEPRSYLDRSYPITCISRSTSVGLPVEGNVESDLRLSDMRSKCISSSWSSEFFDLIRDAGITDSNTQRKMKKMIDDRYHFLFDKKYPELQCLYSSIEFKNRDADYNSEKSSFSKHRKRRMVKKRNISIDSDGYDRLKPPEMIYSEARPPTKRHTPYNAERRSSAPNVKYIPTKSKESKCSKRSQDVRPTKETESANKTPFKDINMRKYENPYTARDNLVATIYDDPWEQNENAAAILRQVKSFEAPRTSYTETDYESLNMIRSNSEKAFLRNSSSPEDRVIYERICSGRKDRNTKDKEPAGMGVEKDPPIPPSSPPPQNPNLQKMNCSTARDQIQENEFSSSDDTKREKIFAGDRVQLRSNRLSSTGSVTDFPADTVWRRSSTSDLVNTEPYDSDAFGEARFVRSTSFIASSCDTPLEHPSSEDDDEVIVDGSSRRQSFYKDVMYVHTDDDQRDSSSDGSVSGYIPPQRLTTPVEYDESIPISKV